MDGRPVQGDDDSPMSTEARHHHHLTTLQGYAAYIIMNGRKEVTDIYQSGKWFVSAVRLH